MTKLDDDALQLALDLTLADDPPDPGRVEQVQDKLRDGHWQETAEFASYHQQMRRLNLLPNQFPPCWMDEEEADAILQRGPRPSVNGSRADISSCASALIFKRMLAANISQYHPDPLRALADVKKKAR